MQTLKDVAQQARFQAMQPGAISERQALDAAITAVANVDPAHGHLVITLDSTQGGCQIMTSNNAVWLYPPIKECIGWNAAVSVGRHHGQPSGETWFGTERAKDAQGRTWERTFVAVMDDFGSLVEVAS